MSRPPTLAYGSPSGLQLPKLGLLSLPSEHAAAKTAPDWDGDVELFALCGDSTVTLIAQLDAQRGALAAGASWLDVRRAAHASRAQFRSDAPCRPRAFFGVDVER